MSSPQARAETELVGTRFVDHRGRIPNSPKPGNYVVVDVLYFSTTVVELFKNGAASVHVPDTREGVVAFKREHPAAIVGGEPTREDKSAEGCDFFNSPSCVQSLDLSGRPVSMTSRNGGRAVADLRAAGGDVDVYVGSTTNATALARHLRAKGRPTVLVGAGTACEPAVEDAVGALLIARHLAGDAPMPAEVDAYRRLVTRAKGPDYLETSEVRRRDVEEFATAVGSRSVVPKLNGESLVDVAGREQVATITDAAT